MFVLQAGNKKRMRDLDTSRQVVMPSGNKNGSKLALDTTEQGVLRGKESGAKPGDAVPKDAATSDKKQASHDNIFKRGKDTTGGPQNTIEVTFVPLSTSVGKDDGKAVGLFATLGDKLKYCEPDGKWNVEKMIKDGKEPAEVLVLLPVRGKLEVGIGVPIRGSVSELKERERKYTSDEIRRNREPLY